MSERDADQPQIKESAPKSDNTWADISRAVIDGAIAGVVGGIGAAAAGAARAATSGDGNGSNADAPKKPAANEPPHQEKLEIVPFDFKKNNVMERYQPKQAYFYEHIEMNPTMNLKLKPFDFKKALDEMIEKNQPKQAYIEKVQVIPKMTLELKPFDFKKSLDEIIEKNQPKQAHIERIQNVLPKEQKKEK
jgi:hypothetical protein